MRYNVTLVDPSTYKLAHILTDICRTIALGIRSLGHRCDLTTNYVDVNSTNIIVGTHLLQPDEIRGIIQSGAPYIILHTEWLSAAPVESGVSVVSTFQGVQFEAHQRELLQRAQLVWEAWDNNRAMLGHLEIPPERLRRFWIGYHPELAEINHRSWAEKDVDAFFFGSITPRRQRLLQTLSQRMNVVTILDNPEAFRNDLIARTKLNLAIHSTDELNYFSFARIGYLLNNRGVVVSERSGYLTPMEELVVSTDEPGLLATCERLLSTANLAEIAEQAYERYKSLPMTEVLEEILY